MHIQSKTLSWALPGQDSSEKGPEGSPKVTDLDQRLLWAVLLLQYEAVLGLEVTVDNTTFMTVVHSNDKLHDRPQAAIRAHGVGTIWFRGIVP